MSTAHPRSWDRVLAAVAGHGLAVSREPSISEPLGDAAWGDLRREVRRERLEGLFVQAIEDGSVAVEPHQWHQVLEDHREAMTAAVMLEHRLVGLVTRLASVGVELRALKGPSFAHLVYERPELRPFGDLDVLVRSADFSTVCAVLQAAGGRRRFPEPHPGFDRRFTKGASVVMADHEVDVHRTLALGPFGLLIDVDELFDGVDHFFLGGRPVPALDRERRFLHACVHAILGQREPRLIGLRDVAEIALDDRLDVETVVRLSERWHCGVVVADAVTSAWSSLRPPTRPRMLAWAEAFVPDSTDLRRLGAYRGEARSGARLALESVRAIDGFGARAAYLRAVLFPTQARQGRIERWTGAFRSLGWVR